ncbi:MAG: hypothetical protein ACI395_10390 [Candidatus Cryptobacteroides sp.]
MTQRLFIVFITLLCAGLCSCAEPFDNPSTPVDEDEETADVLSPVMVKYQKAGSTETFYVALQDRTVKSKYFVMTVNHYKDLSDEKYMDLWRVNGANLSIWKDGAFTVLVDKLLTDGENESVLRDCTDDSVMADFTGGFHGDERIDIGEGCGVRFLLDGEPVPTTSSFDWRGGTEFVYEQESTLHKTGSKIDGTFYPSDHHIIASHTKHTVFGSSFYSTENTLVFAQEFPMYWYCGICCVGHNLADRGCNEDMKMVTFDSSGDNKLDALGKNQFYAWHDVNGVEVLVVDNLLEGGTDAQCRSFIWDTKNYAKYYKRFPSNGSYTVSPSETFRSVMTVSFSTR